GKRLHDEEVEVVAIHGRLRSRGELSTRPYRFDGLWERKEYRLCVARRLPRRNGRKRAARITGAICGTSSKESRQRLRPIPRRPGDALLHVGLLHRPERCARAASEGGVRDGLCPDVAGPVRLLPELLHFR